MEKYKKQLDDIFLKMTSLYQNMLVNYRKIIKNTGASVSRNQMIEFENKKEQEIPQYTSEFVDLLVNKTRLDYENETYAQILYDIYSTQAEIGLMTEITKNQKLKEEFHKNNDKMAELTALYEITAHEALKHIRN